MNDIPYILKWGRNLCLFVFPTMTETNKHFSIFLPPSSHTSLYLYLHFMWILQVLDIWGKIAWIEDIILSFSIFGLSLWIHHVCNCSISNLPPYWNLSESSDGFCVCGSFSSHSWYLTSIYFMLSFIQQIIIK